MYLVGLTGGIGSGKSTVARMLAQRGAVVVDADAIAREVVAAGTTGFESVVTRFGPEVVGEDGEVDRSLLAERVFADADARRDLERITHPLVGERIASRLAELAAEDVIVVLDVPLLAEVAIDRPYAAVLVVTAPADVRVARVVAARGLTPGEVRARIAAQASDAERARVATHLLDNSGSLAELEGRVDEVHRELAAAARDRRTFAPFGREADPG